MTFQALLEKDASASDIRDHLDNLDAEARVRESLSLPGALLPKLFEAVKGQQASLSSFVDVINETVIYELLNNLPLFRVGQKRFFRTEEETVGYNHQPALVMMFTGPGYFFAQDGDGELFFDYTKLPTVQPEGWPEITENRGLIPGLTYGGMTDLVRRVSERTYIGRASKNGKPQDVYFLLTRSAAQS